MIRVIIIDIFVSYLESKHFKYMCACDVIHAAKEFGNIAWRIDDMTQPSIKMHITLGWKS